MSVMSYFISIGRTDVARPVLQTTRTDVAAVLSYHNRGQHSVRAEEKDRDSLGTLPTRLKPCASWSVMATTMPVVSFKKRRLRTCIITCRLTFIARQSTGVSDLSRWLYVWLRDVIVYCGVIAVTVTGTGGGCVRYGNRCFVTS
jgi:hypothetical protein